MSIARIQVMSRLGLELGFVLAVELVVIRLETLLFASTNGYANRSC